MAVGNRGKGRKNKHSKSTKKTKKSKAITHSLTKNQKLEVKRLVRSQVETKRTNFYQQYQSGTTPVTAPPGGGFANRGWALQNNKIANNFTDILRLIPEVIQGVDDWNRIGQKISPTSLVVKGSLRIRSDVIVPTPSGSSQLSGPVDFSVDIFVLQHVSLKDYAHLYAENDFTELLETGVGTTTLYNGEPTSHALRVAKQFYKVLHRKKITLRYAGAQAVNAQPVGLAVGQAVSVSNAHTWYADYTMNLGKHLPKTLMYPEDSITDPTVLNAPTNSSMFMCMAFPYWLSLDNFGGAEGGEPARALFQQTYVSELSFKDM